MKAKKKNSEVTTNWTSVCSKFKPNK